MLGLRQVNKEDVMFIAGETDQIYQHIAALMILDTSDKPDFSFEKFRQRCIERTAAMPNFRWKLHAVPLGLDRPYWVEDESFNYENHIRRIALPSPGDRQALSEVVSLLYCRHLDRSRPLWEIWLIEGLEGDRFAYLQIFHHCMMDGEGAVKIIAQLCDLQPNPKTGRKPSDETLQMQAGKIPSPQEQSSKMAQHWARLPGEAARSMYDMLAPRMIERLSWPRKAPVELPKRNSAPTVSFNGEIGMARSLAFTSLPLDAIKTVKTHFGVSVNDVILALVAGVIRNYLARHSELPEEPLRANVPVSLRTEADGDLGNRVTTVTVTLATDMEDPAKRLKAIQADTERAKVQARSGGSGVTDIFQMMPPIMISAVMGSLPAEQAPQIMGANLVVSSVRGSSGSMYIAGARVEAMYPMSILTAGMGVNFTCASYRDKVDIGMTIDPARFTGLWSAVDELHVQLKQYLVLTRSKKKAPTKKKAAPRKAIPGKKDKLR